MSGLSVVKYQPKRKCDTQSAIDSTNDIKPPLDFSFCGFSDAAEALDEEPRLRIYPRSKGKQPPPPEEGCKSSSQCLRFNNNSISNLETLKTVTEGKFIDWQNLAWIDLSHNELTKLGPELTYFVNLQILYLHGNQINDEKEIDSLTPIKSLRKLTLHGNPVETIKAYRSVMLSKLPQLQTFDFSLVTKADKKNSETWEKMLSGQKKKKKVEEE